MVQIFIEELKSICSKATNKRNIGKFNADILLENPITTEKVPQQRKK